MFDVCHFDMFENGARQVRHGFPPKSHSSDVLQVEEDNDTWPCHGWNYGINHRRFWEDKDHFEAQHGWVQLIFEWTME